MLRVIVTIIASLCAITAFAARSPTPFSEPQLTASSKQYCTTASPTSVTGVYVPYSSTMVVAASGVGSVTTITESDISGGVYVTKVDTSVANTTGVSCPLKQ